MGVGSFEKLQAGLECRARGVRAGGYRRDIVGADRVGHQPPVRGRSRTLMAGVYISYPFCAQKCTYCNFASGVFPRELEPRYLRALESEIASHRWQWTPDTVYLGGGTPSQMSVEALTHLL